MSVNRSLWDESDPLSVLYNFRHRPELVPPNVTKPVLENVLLAVAAGGPVLFLLIVPLTIWLFTRSVESFTRLFSTKSLSATVASSLVWMFFTSFAFKNDDCMELVVAYPILMAVSLVYLILIWGQRSNYCKAGVSMIVVMLCVGSLFYIIRFEPAAGMAQDFIGVLGFASSVVLSTMTLIDIQDLAGVWYIAIAFVNAGLNILLSTMTCFVLIKKYPVAYYAILNSFTGVIFGIAQVLFLIHRSCCLRHNGPENNPPMDPNNGPHNGQVAEPHNGQVAEPHNGQVAEAHAQVIVDNGHPEAPVLENAAAEPHDGQVPPHAQLNSDADHPQAAILENDAAQPQNDVAENPSHFINIPNDLVNGSQFDSSFEEGCHQTFHQIVTPAQGIISLPPEEIWKTADTESRVLTAVKEIAKDCHKNVREKSHDADISASGSRASLFSLRRRAPRNNGSSSANPGLGSHTKKSNVRKHPLYRACAAICGACCST